MLPTLKAFWYAFVNLYSSPKKLVILQTSSSAMYKSCATFFIPFNFLATALPKTLYKLLKADVSGLHWTEPDGSTDG